MTFHPDRPFNDLPPLPPAQDIETKPVLKACNESVLNNALCRARHPKWSFRFRTH